MYFCDAEAFALDASGGVMQCLRCYALHEIPMDIACAALLGRLPPALAAAVTEWLAEG